MGCVHGKCCSQKMCCFHGKCCCQNIGCFHGKCCSQKIGCFHGKCCNLNMGCFHGKCCSRYPQSSDGDNRDPQELGIYTGHGKHITADTSIDSVPVPSHNFWLEYSVLAQRGYYPEMPDKENQDSFCIRTHIQGNPNVHFFGVFDGHGLFGTQCSNFVKNRLVEILSSDPTLLVDPVKAYNSAFLATNYELHDSDIDDSLSGTTAITVLVIGDTLYVANVGDSRSVIAVKEGNRIVAEDLSYDQTPFRKDECERVKLCGARVLSVDQVEGLKDPGIQSWGEEETEGSDPPRLWVQNGMYPGTAFTRSVGDSAAEKIGVVAVPEVSMIQLTPEHPFFVVASDGIFEFLSSQTVVDMVPRYADSRDACSAIASESYKLWLEHENRTDDITIIIVHVRDLSNSGVNVTNTSSGLNIRRAALNTKKETSDMHTTPSGSEFYRSVRSDFSDPQPGQHIMSTDQSPTYVVPSATLPRPSEYD